MMDTTALRRAYDEQLRTDAETPSALSVTTLGPLRLVTFSGGRGFITYQDLGGADAGEIERLVAEALAHYEADGAVVKVEWKTRGHDRAPGLHDALIARGFEPEDPESVMIGEAASLVADIPLPDGVTVRKVEDERDVRAMCAMQDRVFGGQVSVEYADAILSRLARGDGMELWVAEHDGEIVSAGRLEPVAGTDFAGIWGGATLEKWRGKGIYRALTSARARSALALGKRFMHSDSTEFSRPILERSGLVKVSTTTPYVWRR
ncbi:GNAT family N-acetyltransferase [Microbacterium paludicola]|uniref:GNAT family N-acetyltransferase n=1 Tax=Microbacterium paludicola TaxID=300019 RepID=UPI0031DD8FC0